MNYFMTSYYLVGAYLVVKIKKTPSHELSKEYVTEIHWAHKIKILKFGGYAPNKRIHSCDHYTAGPLCQNSEAINN